MGHRGAVVLSPMFTLDESKQLSGEIEKNRFTEKRGTLECLLIYL